MHELATWLLQQIEITTELERLAMIGNAIQHDKAINAEYLRNGNIDVLRKAWAKKKEELDKAAGVDNITNVENKATTND